VKLINVISWKDEVPASGFTIEPMQPRAKGIAWRCMEKKFALAIGASTILSILGATNLNGFA
jgi:hypothetical protein